MQRTPDLDAAAPAAQRHSTPATARNWRIACVSETYPPEVNGVALTVARIVDGLRLRGHSVQLIRPRQPGDANPESTRPEAGPAAPDELLQRSLPIPRYPGLRMGVPCRRTLQQAWQRQRPDVVHIATEGPLGWSALQAALNLGLPLCSDFRTNFHLYAGHYGIGLLGRAVLGHLRRFHNRTGFTMVPTEALRNELAEAGFKHLRVVSRGVDTQLFAPQRRDAALRHQWGVGDGDPVLACVGRLAREKNLDLALAAFRAVQAQQPRARLLLVGSGPCEAALRAACPQALFAGQRRGSDLAAHYASADMLLLPSLTETFGNVTTEALSSGLPVLAFNRAAAGELIEHGVNGHLVAVEDAPGFVATALTLAADAPLRQRIGRAARERALALGWEAVVESFEAVLHDAMRAHPHAARAPAGWLREA